MASHYQSPSTIICLNCFKEFPPWDMLFSGASGEMKTATPPRGFRRKPRVPEFALGTNGQPLRDKHCPQCKEPLPWVAGQQEELILGLVGARFSGKSHYIATLIRRLQKEVSRNFNASLIPLDDTTRVRYRREFYEPLFEDKQQLAFTQPGAKSLLYRFALEDTTGDKNQPGRAVTLAFYDTAGEDFATPQAVEQFVTYLTHAKGLIFLIDPLQIESIREIVGARAQRHAIHQAGEPETIIGVVINHLGKHNLLNKQGKFPISVAVVFTKCDMLRDIKSLIDPHRLWARSDIQHRRFYNLDLHNDTNALFGQYLDEWDRGGSVQGVRTNFQDYAFFGVSATGCDADESGNYPYIAPWRVEDPLLWLLYRLHVIESGR